MTPPAHSAVPAMLWPPPRTDRATRCPGRSGRMRGRRRYRAAAPRARGAARSWRSRSGTPRRSRHLRARKARSPRPAANAARPWRLSHGQGMKGRSRGHRFAPDDTLSSAASGYEPALSQGDPPPASPRSAVAFSPWPECSRHERLWPVLPNRQRRQSPCGALDAFGPARADLWRHALQRPATRRAADVGVAALAAPQVPQAGGRVRAPARRAGPAPAPA